MGDSLMLLGCHEARKEAGHWTVYGSVKRTGIKTNHTIMNDQSTNGHRHLCYSVKGRTVDLATTIRDNYAALGFSPTTRTYPKFLLWIVKFFNADVASIYPLLGKETLRETNYPEVYHYHYTDFSQMVRDTMDDLLEKKVLQAKGK